MMRQDSISNWAWSSMGFGILAAILLIFSGYGYQWGWWGLGTAFTWLLPGGAVAGLISFSLSVVFGFARWRNPPEKGAGIALIGLVLGIAAMGTVGYWFMEAQKYPPIHDITTDIQNPPEFDKIVQLREQSGAPNDTTYGDSTKAATQREVYPDLQTLYLDQPYSQAFDQALSAARQMPWEQIVTSDKERGIIEAVDKLAWFGFKDDIVIRVDTADNENRSKIDVRSVSRIGRGDIGVNAERIRRYLDTVKKQQ